MSEEEDVVFVEQDYADAPLDEALAAAREQMEKWRTTLDWLAER